MVAAAAAGAGAGGEMRGSMIVTTHMSHTVMTYLRAPPCTHCLIGWFMAWNANDTLVGAGKGAFRSVGHFDAFLRFPTNVWSRVKSAKDLETTNRPTRELFF